jgi:hypothetical protein
MNISGGGSGGSRKLLLAVDDFKCADCGMCAVTWPAWANAGRRWPLDSNDPSDQEFMKLAEKIHKGCPERAILYKVRN